MERQTNQDRLKISPKEALRWLIKAGVATATIMGLTLYGAHLNQQREQEEAERRLNIQGGVQVLGAEPGEKIRVELIPSPYTGTVDVVEGGPFDLMQFIVENHQPVTPTQKP